MVYKSQEQKIFYWGTLGSFETFLEALVKKENFLDLNENTYDAKIKLNKAINKFIVKMRKKIFLLLKEEEKRISKQTKK